MNLLSAPRQPFVGLALIAGIGITLADFLPFSSLVLLWVLAIVAIGVLIWPSSILTHVLVGTGFFWLHSFHLQNSPGLRLAAQLGGAPRAISATGAVISEPKIASNGFSNFLLRLESIDLERKHELTAATIMVRWRGIPEFGDDLKLFGIAGEVPSPRNPGEFDLRSYLAHRDIHRSLLVRYAEDGVVLQHGGGNPILRAAHTSRGWMQATLCRGLEDSPDVQNFISGIALGLRHQTPEDIEEPFQQTGTLHLFAVAGLHVGIVARLLWMLATVARLSRKWAAGLIIPLVLFYAAVTGLHVSSVRAAMMCSILLGGLFFERKVFAFNSLAAAAFFLLCWDTNQFFTTGFQLSFAVVGGILLLAEPLSRMMIRWVTPDPFLPRNLLSAPRRLIHVCFGWICRGASVSLAAWIGSLPLVWWYFNLATPISLIANLVVVPLAFFILAIGLLSLLTAPILSTVSVVFNSTNWLLAKLVFALVHLFAQIPGGHYYFEHPHWPAPVNAKVMVLDAGAGAAVHLHSGNADWLFDCGSERNYERTLRAYLHSAGVNRLTGLLLTHGDALHIGAAARLLDDLPPGILIDNAAGDHSVVHRRLRLEFWRRGFRSKKLFAGEDVALSQCVLAKILHPPPGFAATTGDDQALVIQLTIEPSTKVLLLSDSGYETENALIASGADLRSDVIVKGQHHSGQSGSDAFLDAVRPRLIVATSRDFPGHERVSDEWVAGVRARGIKLFRQDETGAVELRFASDEWIARAYITGETFRSSNR
jgi:ComEC/Rec2-related protein